MVHPDVVRLNVREQLRTDVQAVVSALVAQSRDQTVPAFKHAVDHTVVDFIEAFDMLEDFKRRVLEHPARIDRLNCYVISFRVRRDTSSADCHVSAIEIIVRKP